MFLTVYFADKSVSFTREVSSEGSYNLVFAKDEDADRAKILKILETNNSVAVVTADPERAFHAFASGFAAVEAAGGVVVNDRGEWLMILRNGRWDLPKGHVESGESVEQAAVREVGEETGVDGARIVRPLCTTLHAYHMHGRWELKHTHWFEMRAECARLAPQTEEGIERAAWCTAAEVRENLDGVFPTIRRVMEAMSK